MACRSTRTVVAVMVAALLATWAVPSSAQVPDCGTVHLVWARGSGLGIGAFDFAGYSERLSSRIDQDLGVTYSSFQLGSAGGIGGFDYPAVGNLSSLAGAFFGTGSSYQASVSQGIGELSAYLADRTAACQDEVYVLAGFSQGAQVIGEGLASLPRSIRDRVAAVNLFGDPTRATNNQVGSVPFPRECFGDKPVWSRGTAPCTSLGGILDARRPYVPDDIAARTGSWCRRFDGVCTGRLTELATAFGTSMDGAHFSYFDDGKDVDAAVLEAAERLAARLPAHAEAFDVTFLPFAVGVTGADLAFVIDTTGSMGGAIATVRAQAVELAEAWVAGLPNARVGLVQYRDQFDAFTARTELELTDDVAAFKSAVDGLRASGGGDRPEAVLSGISQALETMPWATGATKAAIVIADAPGRDPEPGSGLTRADIIERARELNPVALFLVNTSTAADVDEFFVPLAEGTNGGILRAGASLSDALFDTLQLIQTNPLAVASGPYLVPVDTPIEFSAARSRAVEGDIVRYRWDFNNDGTFEIDTDQPDVVYTYPGTFNGLAVLEVTDEAGRTDLAITDVTVNDVGLADQLPLDPVAAEAVSNGDGTTTISWTAAESDRADGYTVRDPDGRLLGWTMPSGDGSVVVADALLRSEVVVHADNDAGRSAGVAVPIGTFTFSGFLSPVDDPPAVNTVQAGRAVPVRFSLGGDQGMDIFADGSPSVEHVPCGGGPVADVEETSTRDHSGLRYASGSDQYTYLWSTDRTWSGTCRELHLTFRDGQTHHARFAFR